MLFATPELESWIDHECVLAFEPTLVVRERCAEIGPNVTSIERSDSRLCAEPRCIENDFECAASRVTFTRHRAVPEPGVSILSH
jgi:hypothetical protein